MARLICVWTVIKKNHENIKDIVPVLINDAQGVTLFGEKINCLSDLSI